MTADQDLTRGTLIIDVVIHVSGIVCLEPPRTLVVPGHSTSNRRRRARTAAPHMSVRQTRRTPTAVEPGL